MADSALYKLLEFVKPENNFTLDNVPQAPDYNLKDNWLALPDTKGYELLVPSSCLLYTSPSPRDGLLSRMPSSA